MRTRWSSASGMSLVEATIILMTLGVLTSVVSPSVSDYVNDAKQVKVKEDCEAIGTAVARVMRDVGPCLRVNGAQPCTTSNRVDLLVSAGPDVQATDLGGAATPFAGTGVSGSLNWDRDEGANVDSMESQFVANGAGYGTPATLGTYNLTGPQMGLGWRGAYLSGPIGPDPWGRRYMVNTAFLAVARDAGGEAGWAQDVFCLSAGANGSYETPIAPAGSGTVRLGDDFVYIISGGTR